MTNRLKLDDLRLRFLQAFNEYNKINESVKLRQQSGKDHFGEMLLEDARKKMNRANNEYFNFWQDCIKSNCLEEEVMYA